MKDKRLFLTGAGGFVGGHVLIAALPDWQVIGFTRSPAPLVHPRLIWWQHTLLDQEALARAFVLHRPTAVIHAAAMSDIDACEEQPELAYQMNVGVTQRIVQLCGQFGSKLVFTSTDTVFGGSKRFYREQDPVDPANYYGRTKVEAEQCVLQESSGAVVARLSLVAGLAAFDRGNSFIVRALTALTSGKPIAVPDDEFRTPVWVHTVSQALLELAAGEWSGLFHLAGNERLSRYEAVRRLADRLGASPDLVQIKNSPYLGGRAPRPKDVSLDNRKARSTLTTTFLDFNQTLGRILEEMRNVGSRNQT